MSQSVSSDRVPEFSLGERIRKSREDVGLSQQQLADKLNVDRKTLGGWEKGHHRPSYSDLMLISSTTNVNFAWLDSGGPRPDPAQGDPGVTHQYRSSTLLPAPSPGVTRTSVAA